MLGFILTLVVTAVSLIIIARYIPIGVEVEELSTAAIAALVLGILNATLRPILGFLATPITFVTFGLFSIVLNAIILYIAAALVPGFRVKGFLSALMAAIVLGLLNSLIFWILPGV